MSIRLGCGLSFQVEAVARRAELPNAVGLVGWLCQLRVAPYSYDWIDNAGRRSPPELIPGLERLEIGQDVMTIFTLTSFTRNEHLTIRLKPTRRVKSLFGEIAVSYLIVPKGETSCRLLVKLAVQNPRTLRGRLIRRLLPWGDLIMMRRQLLNLKRLAEIVVAKR